MKYVNKLATSILFLFSFNITLYSQEDPESLLTDAKMDFTVMYSPYQYDFHSFAIIYSGWAINFDLGAEYGYILQKYVSNKYVTIVDHVFYNINEPKKDNIWYGYDGLQYPGEFSAPYGNGIYRVKGYVRANAHFMPAYDETGWAVGSVNDITAPSAPTNLQVAWQSGHPKLTWSLNLEVDVQSYKIYKMVVGETGWANVAMVSNTTTQWIDNTVEPAGPFDPVYTISYKIQAVDYSSNTSSYSSTQSIDGTTDTFWKTSNNITDVIIDHFELSPNYPNPFNPSTNIEFQLPENSYVKLSVYNSIGQEVAILVSATLEKGKYSEEFNGANLPSGVYFYKLQTDSFTDIKKMLLTK